MESSLAPMLLPISEEMGISNVGYGYVYTRFSERQNQVIIALVSAYAFMHLIIVQTIRLYIPQVAADLNTQPSVVGLSIGLWLFAACFGGLAGGAYSTFSGRRPVLLVGASLMSMGSINVALCRSVPVLMLSRIFEGFGAACGVYVGSAVIGDIYQLEQRGNALGVLRAASFIGVVLALPIGGFVTAHASWRTLQLGLGTLGGLIFVLMFLYFPETSHPGARGIDKIPYSDRTLGTMIINPLKPLGLLRSPNVFAIVSTDFGPQFAFNRHRFIVSSNAQRLRGGIKLVDLRVVSVQQILKPFLLALTVPVAYTLGSKFNINDPTTISVCLVLVSIGNIFGTSLSGIVSDRVIVKYTANREGVWLPEDRLRIALPATLGGVPSSVLIFALAAEYLPNHWLGLLVCLSCLFLNGFVVEFVLNPSIGYLIDLLPERSAEAVAATTSLSLFLLSFAVAWVIPLIDTLGIMGTSIIAALLAWGGHIILWCIIRYGDRMKT